MKLSTSWAMALLTNPCIALQMCKSNYYVMYYIEKNDKFKQSKTVSAFKRHRPIVVISCLGAELLKHILYVNHNTLPNSTINMQLNNISHF